MTDISQMSQQERDELGEINPEPRLSSAEERSLKEEIQYYIKYRNDTSRLWSREFLRKAIPYLWAKVENFQVERLLLLDELTALRDSSMKLVLQDKETRHTEICKAIVYGAAMGFAIGMFAGFWLFAIH